MLRASIVQKNETYFKIATYILNSYDFPDSSTKQIEVFQIYTSMVTKRCSACCLLHDGFLLDLDSTPKMG
jgi:hypothetical protein